MESYDPQMQRYLVSVVPRADTLRWMRAQVLPSGGVPLQAKLRLMLPALLGIGLRRENLVLPSNVSGSDPG